MEAQMPEQNSNQTTCPKCGYVRQLTDKGPDNECPKCNVIYSKFEAAIAKKKLLEAEEQKRIEKNRLDTEAKAQRDAEKKRLKAEDKAQRDAEESRLVAAAKAEESRLAAEAEAKARRLKEAKAVVVVDLDMPFGSMVSFMVEWAIATIPAAIILFILGCILMGIFTAIING